MNFSCFSLYKTCTGSVQHYPTGWVTGVHFPTGQWWNISVLHLAG